MREAEGAIELSRRVAEPPPRVELLLWLAEGCVYGLPPFSLEVAEGLVKNTPDDLALRVYAGACAFVDPEGSPQTLADGAAALQSSKVGPRRAVLRTISCLLEAEARRRVGETSGARLEAEAGLASAVALGHAWLEAHLLKALVGLDAGDAYADRLREKVRALAGGLASEKERETLLRVWSYGA